MLPVVFWKFNPSDALTHLYDAKEIEKNGGKIPIKLTQFFPEVQFPYPYGIAWVLYKIGPKIHYF